MTSSPCSVEGWTLAAAHRQVSPFRSVASPGYRCLSDPGVFVNTVQTFMVLKSLMLCNGYKRYCFRDGFSGCWK